MIEVIEESHFNSKIAIINIFFCLISFSFNYSEALFRDNKRHMSHGFREYFPLISSKTIKFAPSMWVRYDSAVTPLFCRQRLYIQQMNSTLTVNRQNGQKQIGQIHLFNLLLPNLPIDFILVDNIGQRIPPVAPERTQGWVNERQTQEACYTIRPMITNTRGVTLWRLCASSS